MYSGVKVIRTLELSVPGLGDRIKNARENDPRSLSVICGAIGMSATNWYRIESEKQLLPEETLRKIESALNVDFGVKFDE